MYLGKDNFIFNGFDPSKDLKLYGKEVYSLVEDKAPSQSTKTAYITKTKAGYEGVLHVTSSVGIFKANSQHREAKPLIDELYKKMSLQILDWKNSRNQALEK